MKLHIPKQIGVTAEGKKIELPADLITQGVAWLAKRRRGKSYGAGVEMEIFAARRDPFVVLDPAAAHVGLKYKMADDGRNPDGPSGLNVLVVGGDHGDVPFDPHGGKIFAEVVVEHDVSAVVDLKRVGRADRMRFVADFADHLFLINKTPRHVFLEEAQNFIPQNLRFEDQMKVFVACETLIKEGGGQGIGFTIISQRPASIAKDALNMIDNLVVLGMSGTTDIKAVKDWCNNNAPELVDQLIKDLAALAPGEAWLIAPESLPEKAVRIRIRPRVTWHAGRTPRRGDVQPKRLKNVAAIANQFKSLLEERKADWAADQKSQKELQAALRDREREVERLKKQLERKPQVSVPAQVPAPVLDKKVIKLAVEKAVMESSKDRDAQWREALQKYQTALHKLQHHRQASISDSLKKLDGAITLQLANVMETVKFDAPRAVTKVAAKIDFDFGKIAAAAFPQRPPVPHTSAQVTGTPAPGGATAPPGAAAANNGAGQGAPDIGKSPRQMILTIMQWRERGITRQQLASMTGIKSRGSSMRTYLTTLRRHNYLVEKNGLLFPSDQALQDFADVHSEGPQTTAEVVEIWKPRIGATPAKILDMLVDRQGGPLSREEVAGALEIDPAGSSMRTYLTTLRRAGLMVDVDGKAIAANRETLLL
ncbi:MAG: hypothetical protein ACJ71W_05875 [Terriglobales bacterium]